MVLLISQLPDIVKICYCTPDGPIDPTLQMNMYQPSSMFVTGEIKQKQSGAFFLRHPVPMKLLFRLAGLVAGWPDGWVFEWKIGLTQPQLN